MATPRHDVPTTVSSLDKNMAFLGSAAAIELDAAVRGENADWDVVNKLQILLQSRIPSKEETGSSTRSLLQMDPATADLLGRAWLMMGHEIDSIEQLRSFAEDMGERLARAPGEHDEGSLRELRSFCVALSQIAQLELAARRQTRPTSKFRR